VVTLVSSPDQNPDKSSDTNSGKDSGPDTGSQQPPKGQPPVNDQLDVTVHDSEVLAEIEMMTNLIIATSESEGPLPQGQIDEILGIVDNDGPPV
jgi:hypothetical protein